MDEMPIMRFLGIRINVPRDDDVYVAELDVTQRQRTGVKRLTYRDGC